MPEAIASQLSPGAGRFRDFIWPDPAALDNPPAAQITSRDSTINTAGAVVTGGPCGNAAWLGVECASLGSNGAGGTTILRFDGGMNMHIKTARVAIPPANDDEHCFRVYCNMAIAAAPNAGAEMAWNCTAADGNGWLTGGSPATGWGFYFADANSVFLRARGPNGTVVTQVLAGDVTQWHSYELRITNATATADAQFQVRIDGVVVNVPPAFSSWAAGTNLPGAAVRATRVGFRPVLASGDGKANQLYVSCLRMMSAPTPLALL